MFVKKLHSSGFVFFLINHFFLRFLKHFLSDFLFLFEYFRHVAQSISCQKDAKIRKLVCLALEKKKSCVVALIVEGGSGVGECRRSPWNAGGPSINRGVANLSKVQILSRSNLKRGKVCASSRYTQNRLKLYALSRRF